MEQRYTDPDKPGLFERMRQQATGMTRAQRIVAKNPNADIPLYMLNAKELEAWREGGDWTAVSPEIAKKAQMRNAGRAEARSQRQPG